MSLSKETMRMIVLAVSADDEACYRINSWMRWFAVHAGGETSAGPSSGGLAGATRNLGMALVSGLSNGKLFDPSDIESRGYKYSCDGIAEAASKAIAGALPKIPAVSKVYPQARLVSYSHTGVCLEMADKSKYVADWWKSLDVKNPILFRFDDFMYDRGNWVGYDMFRGFSD